MNTRKIDFKLLLIQLALLYLSIGTCKPNKKAFHRITECREPSIKDNNEIAMHVEEIVPTNSQKDKLKGFMGTIGIIGGCLDNTGSPYFAAMAALKTGADSVNIFSTVVAANAIKAYNPEINVQPVFNAAGNKMFEQITLMDAIVLGPGLEREVYVTNLLPRIIEQCKKEKKPLVVDLDEYFLTPTVIKLFYNYPLPGVIFMVNSLEFEKMYVEMKVTSPASDTSINIDYKKVGENIFIFRKGCTDMGLSKNHDYTWLLSDGGSSRRCMGQGDMLAGSTATYFFWATRQLHINSTANYHPMLPPAVATLSAAKLIRASNRKAFQEKSRSMLTTDMIDSIPSAIFDMF